MYSLKKRLVLLSTVSITIILVIGLALASDQVFKRLQESYDDSIKRKIGVLTILAEYEPYEDGLEFELDAGMLPEFESELNAEYFSIWIEGNQLFEKSQSLQEGQKIEYRDVPLGEYRFEDILLPDGRTGRVGFASFYPRVDIDLEDEEVTLAELNKDDYVIPRLVIGLAVERESLNDLLSSVTKVGIWAIALIVLCVALTIWLLARVLFRPFDSLKNQLNQISESNLSYRISQGMGATEEMDVIVVTINSLLERLDLAFQKVNAFTTGAAHELYTPISELRILSDVAHQLPGDEETKKFFVDVDNAARKMESLVNGLIEITGLETNCVQEQIENIQLRDAVLELYADIERKEGLSRKVNIDVSEDELIRTDERIFKLLLKNLIGNAMCHSATDSSISVRTFEEDSTLSFRVCNQTDDLEQEDLRFIEDRFWRKDQARPNSGHLGLGLSICKLAADHLGYRIYYQLDENGMFCVSVVGLKKYE